MLIHFQLMIFYRFEPLKQLGIGSDETAHGHKGSHNANIHIYGSL